VLARVEAGRAGEDGAAGVVDVLVEGVRGEGLLEPDELGGVLHEGDEEQAAEEGPGLRVDAVGEGVAAAQDPGAAVVLGAGQPDMGPGGDGQQEDGGTPGLAVKGAPPETRRAVRAGQARHRQASSIRNGGGISPKELTGPSGNDSRTLATPAGVSTPNSSPNRPEREDVR